MAWGHKFCVLYLNYLVSCEKAKKKWRVNTGEWVAWQTIVFISFTSFFGNKISCRKDTIHGYFTKTNVDVTFLTTLNRWILLNELLRQYSVDRFDRTNLLNISQVCVEWCWFWIQNKIANSYVQFIDWFI